MDNEILFISTRPFVHLTNKKKTTKEHTLTSCSNYVNILPIEALLPLEPVSMEYANCSSDFDRKHSFLPYTEHLTFPLAIKVSPYSLDMANDNIELKEQFSGYKTLHVH